MSPSARRKIGVFNHAGTKNLGDEALLAALVQNIRRRVPDAEIIAFTINPHDTSQRHGISCFPIRRLLKTSPVSQTPVASSTVSGTQASADSRSSLRSRLKALPGLRPMVVALRRMVNTIAAILAEPKFLLESYRRLKGVELLLAAGGQQFNDAWGGPWGFPFTLLKWTILARCRGTKVALLSVGAGPLELPLSKFFVRRLLGLVHYRSYRDAISSRIMEEMGVKGSHPVYPDLVYSLQLPDSKPTRAAKEGVVVGTNIVPFFDGRYWPTPDPVLYEDYVHKFAKFAEWLDQTDHAFFFFPTQVRADSLTISDIRQAMNGTSHSPNVLAGHPIQNIDDLVSEISRADLVVANRYHGILISLMMNKPVLGIAYHEKSRALLEQAGQGDYVLPIDNFKAEDLIERFRAMEANAPALKKRIAERVAPLRHALEEQYDRVFSLIGVRPTAMARTN